MRKSVALLLVLVFLTASCVITFLPVQAEGRTIVVPDDYPTIQAAIRGASEGDTVFVREGTYYADQQESIVIDKPLSLIGENPNYTILANGYVTIEVAADNVTISGFTIKSSEYAIILRNWALAQKDGTIISNCRIVGNKIVNGGYGIWVETGINFLVENNDICNNSRDGIVLYPQGHDGVISENNITGNGLGHHHNDGIYLWGCRNITIANNNLSGGYNGVNLQFSNHCYIYGNNIADNQGYGIAFGIGCNNATIYANNIARNGAGITLDNFNPGGVTITPGNVVFRNNLTDNSMQTLIFTGTTDIVAWDSGSMGNYWSDYLAKYPNASQIGNSGIGNTPYVIDAKNKDRYPLMEPWIVTSPITRDSIPTVITDEPIPTPSPTPTSTPAPTAAPTPTANPTTTPSTSPESYPTPEPQPEPFPTTIVALASVATVAVVGVGLLVYFKKRKH